MCICKELNKNVTDAIQARLDEGTPEEEFKTILTIVNETEDEGEYLIVDGLVTYFNKETKNN